MDIARDDSELFVVTENGYGKRTQVSEYPVKGRGTKGVLTAKLTDEEGRPGRRPDRPRAPGPALHLPERDGPAHPRRRHLADGPPDPGGQSDEHEGRRHRLRRRPRRRLRRPRRGGPTPAELPTNEPTAEEADTIPEDGTSATPTTSSTSPPSHPKLPTYRRPPVFGPGALTGFRVRQRYASGYMTHSRHSRAAPPLVWMRAVPPPTQPPVSTAARPPESWGSPPG